MAYAGKKRGLRDDTAPDVRKIGELCTEDPFVRVFAASPEPTIMTRRKLIHVKKKDNAYGDSHTCTTLVGFADSNLLSPKQNDGPFRKATFSCSVCMTGSGSTIYVLEQYPAAVRAVNLETESVNTLKLDLEHVEGPRFIACGPANNAYIATNTKIYEVSLTSEKCEIFAQGEFSNIEAICVNMAEKTLWVADSGQIQRLSLEHGNIIEDAKSEKKKEWQWQKQAKIRSLECDRVGNVYVTRERGNELAKIDTSGNMTLQRISLAENGIEHIALTGTGDILLLAFYMFKHTQQAMYDVLLLKQPSGEPPYINDTCLRLKRKFLEMSMQEERIINQREDLEDDLANGRCTVELDDKDSQATIKIRFNPRKLKRAMEFFRAWQEFPKESHNVRLPGIDKDVFDDVLEFCYTDTLEAQKQEAMRDLDYFGPRLRAADELGFKSMVEYLELTFIENVTEENAFAMLAFAESMPVKSLIIRMQEYVKTKLKKIAEKSRGAHAELLSHDSLQTLLKSFCNQP